MNLTVMTFNLRYHEPKDGGNAWPNRLNRVVKAIESNQPDLIGTQEGLHSMLVDLQESLSEYDWVGSGRNGGEQGEYCAIFYRKSRFEVIEQGQFWLSETPEVESSKSWDSSLPRICTWVVLREKETGKCLLHFNTHLDHRGPLARLHGVELIYSRMNEERAKRNLPVLLTGDMNCIPESDVIQFLRGNRVDGELRSYLRDCYEKAEQPIGATFNGFKGLIDGEPIDYIFISPGIELLSTRVDRDPYEGGYPSDHYPVITNLLV